MAKYRKKPVVIEAIQNNGDWAVIKDWMVDLAGGVFAFSLGTTPPIYKDDSGDLVVTTLEGTMRADVGDWIIRGVAGEFYPCKPDIFKVTYEPVEEETP